jgi:hypothetical protein
LPRHDSQPLQPPDPIHPIHPTAAQGRLELGNHEEAFEELEQIDAPLHGHPDVLEVRWGSAALSLFASRKSAGDELAHLRDFVLASNWKAAVLLAATTGSHGIHAQANFKTGIRSSGREC